MSNPSKSDANNPNQAEDDIDDLEDQNTLALDSHHPHSVGTNTEVRITRDVYSIFEFLRKENRGQLVLAPDFQRKNVWDTRRQSELVESILMGIPIPLIYLFEDKDGIRQVVDGKQRITALKLFFENELTLSNLTMLSKLRGKKFNEIEPLLQSKFEDYQLQCYVIQPPTPESIKLNIFERVNRGGVNLNKQEMRYALYQGKVTELLNRLASSEAFKNATGEGIESNRMKDHYLLLRFIAFYLREFNLLPEKILYNSNIDVFLSLVMHFINQEIRDDLISEIEQNCVLGLENCNKALGENAFRFPSKKNGQRRPISMGLFEMLVFAFIQIKPINNIEAIKKIVEREKENIEKQNFFSGKIDTTKMVNKRFEIAKRIIEKINESTNA